MLTPQSMAAAYDRNVQIIKMQTAGMHHAESLIQLPFRGNCMNWIVGHILTNRNTIFRLLGAEPAIAQERIARYARESEPITGAEDAEVLPLEELVATLEHAQARLTSLLNAITPEELRREVAFFGNRSMSVSEWLFFFYFHDVYHTGQTEILRQATGKEDKVI